MNQPHKSQKSPKTKILLTKKEVKLPKPHHILSDRQAINQPNRREPPIITSIQKEKHRRKIENPNSSNFPKIKNQIFFLGA